MTLDAVARLALDEAGPLSGRILVLDDSAGALTRAVGASGAEVRTFCDDLRDADAVPPDTLLTSLDDPYLAGVGTVLLRLPKSLGALEEYAQTLAATVNGDLRLVAAGRVKHMTRAQNDVLGRSFARVRASLGRDKCRALDASSALRRPVTWPRSRYDERLGLDVWARGATFAGNRLDPGTALLVDALGRDLADADGRRALDVGCGSGILAAWLARRGWRVSASDVSWAAVDATRRTARANGLAVDCVQADGLAGLAPGSVELIVTNPPFHRGTAKDSTPSLQLFEDAGGVLARGGELWCVFNSHLPYLAALRTAVGPTRIVARDRAYTVARSVRRS